MSCKVVKAASNSAHLSGRRKVVLIYMSLDLFTVSTARPVKSLISPSDSVWVLTLIQPHLLPSLYREKRLSVIVSHKK